MFTQSCSNVKVLLIVFARISFDLSSANGRDQKPAAEGDYNDVRQNPKLGPLSGSGKREWPGVSVWDGVSRKHARARNRRGLGRVARYLAGGAGVDLRLCPSPPRPRPAACL